MNEQHSSVCWRLGSRGHRARQVIPMVLVVVGGCSTAEPTRAPLEAAPTVVRPAVPAVPQTVMSEGVPQRDLSKGLSPLAFDAGSCPATPVVDPSTPGPHVELGPNPLNCANTSNASISSFILTAPRWIVVGPGHTAIYPAPVKVVHGCMPGGVVLTTGDRCVTGAALLQPGVYSMMRCKAGIGSGYLVPPPPPLPNTACSKSLPLPMTEAHRVFEVDRANYYTFNASGSRPWAIRVVSQSGTVGGSYAVEVRTQCTNAATSLQKQEVDVCHNSTFDLQLGVLPAGTYSVILTHRNLGDQFSISAVNY